MPGPDKTLGEFLAQKRISKAFYYSLKRRSLGPGETTYPGSRVVRISAAAERAWDERMAQLAQTEAAKLEAERRRAQAAEAGRIAVASPLHISKRVAHKQQHRRRAR